MFEINIIIKSIICICMIFLQKKRKEKYSIYSSVLIFYIIFFIATPVVTKSYNINFWQYNSTEQLYAKASFITLLFLSIYVVSYELIYRLGNKKIKTLKAEKKSKLKRGRLVIFLSIILIIQLVISDFSIGALFIRDHQGAGESILRTQLSYLINMTFIRTLPIIIFLYYWNVLGEDFKKIDQLIIFIFMIFIAAPTSLPRFMSGVIYLPLIYVYYIKKNTIDYRGLMVIMFLIVFPLMDLVRLFATEQNFSVETIGSILINNFSQGHLDAFQSVMMSISNDKIYYGVQIFGAFLFFIPRVLWSHKPIGSGQEIAENIGLSFTNISMALPGEFYLNLSYLGVLVGACLLGIISAIMDKKYVFNRTNITNKVFYLMIVPMVFMVLRGDAMSAISYTVGVCFACFIWVFIIKRIL